jgi:UDP-N-acetylmuramoyl-tripeptide--D-alanyl-D-alanine ligase
MNCGKLSAETVESRSNITSSCSSLFKELFLFLPAQKAALGSNCACPNTPIGVTSKSINRKYAGKWVAFAKFAVCTLCMAQVKQETEMNELYELFLGSTGIQTDTRKIKKGELFFALKGANFNGNEYAAKAIEESGYYAVIDEAKYEIVGKTILVDDVLKTLQNLAAWHRKTLKIPVIAIGGSNGKTTTKELTYAVLSTKFKTISTLGNENNHIGLPLNILRIKPEHEMAVIEMGANNHGEIALLCEIAQPTHGIITNVGKDHLEGFGSVEGVAKANAEMYDYLRLHNGMVFLNSEETMLIDLAQGIDAKTFPDVKDDYSCVAVKSNSWFLAVETGDGTRIQSNLVGNYNLNNIGAALAIGRYFGVEIEAAKEAIEAYYPKNMRSQFIDTGRNKIILDAYNANPSSMEGALDTFASIEAEHKVLVLGAMYEMGEFAEREHRLLGQKLVGIQDIEAICIAV